MKHVSTIVELIHEVTAHYQNEHSLNSYHDGTWHSLSTKQVLDEAKYLSLGLYSLGIRKGDMIGLITNPSPEWMIVDMAIMSIGAVTIPLFANISHENFKYEIKQTNVHKVFIGGKEAWTTFADCLDLFEEIIAIDDPPSNDLGGKAKRIIKLIDLIEIGKKLNAERPELYADLCSKVRPEDIATIIFTSGSTGTPKGAVHTHSSLTYLFYVEGMGWNLKSDRYLSFLPLAHILARIVNFIMFAWGVSIYFFNDVKNFAVICKKLKPTVIVVVPRILEKIYSRYVDGIENGNFIQRSIGRWAMRLANREAFTRWDKLQLPIADLLVYRKLRDVLGGRLRIILCGGAALSPHLCNFYYNIGLHVYEGWGQTEACPITATPPELVKYGMVGKPIENLEVKVANDGELLVRGPILMKGYYNNEEATRKTIDEDGWLHTGDKGIVDQDNYVKLTGRLKEIYKTSTGEMVTPVPLEQELNKLPFLDSSLIIADGRKFVSCLLVPNFENLQILKQNQNLSDWSDEKFLASDYIKNEIDQHIKSINEHLNNWEHIKAYRFITQPLTIEAGELTPSMKIIRKAVEERYKDLIDSIYQEKGIEHETSSSRH